MAHPAESNWQRLPLAGAHNVRDLGGYPVGMHQTKWHAFLRGDALHGLTDEDCDFLYRYGVRTVIDLRSEAEVLRDPDRTCGEGSIAYVRAALGDEDLSDPDMLEKLDEAGFHSPQDLYASFLENTASIRTIFRAMAQAPKDSAILFHCNSGKDRSGIISMLLLMLAGVSRADCVSDYIVSYPAIFESENDMQRWEQASEKARRTMQEMYQTMGSFTYEWIASHGGARKYLVETCGVPEAELARVCARLV